MSVVETHDAVPMVLTEGAAQKVMNLISEEGNPELKLRVFVTGGGCSGFQYGFSFDEAVNDDDTVIDHKGAKLLVDPLSFQYLAGSEIDYTEGLEGSRFVVRNPLATTTCGCGMSFPSDLATALARASLKTFSVSHLLIYKFLPCEGFCLALTSLVTLNPIFPGNK